MDFKDFDEGLKAFSVNENLSKELYDKKDESVLKVNSDVLYFFLITEGAVEYLKDIMRIGSSSEKIMRQTKKFLLDLNINNFILRNMQ